MPTISQDEDEFDKWLKQIRAALNSPTENAVDFLDNFKLSLYTSEIVVFTPKGEARKMPFGATALDFAYDIHLEDRQQRHQRQDQPQTRTDHHADQQRRPDRDHHGRQCPPQARMARNSDHGQAPNSRSRVSSSANGQNNIERGMQMLDEKMKVAEYQAERPCAAQDHAHLRKQQQGGAVQ